MRKFFVTTGLGIAFISGATMLVAAQKPDVNNTMERLGMHIYKDKNISQYGNQSCQTCHHPLAGFADRSNFLHPYDMVVSVGSDGESLGGRNAPSSAYAGYSPALYSVTNDDGSVDYFGGMFWDGRATGAILGDPLAEQAQGPPLNPVEMAMESSEAVLEVIRDSSYYSLWVQTFGQNIATPPTEDDWNNFARAVAAYERSEDVTKFTSKFDLAHEKFTEQEQVGEDLFENHCASCHATTTTKPLFTTYGYANIGVPANPLLGSQPPDLGLGPIVNDPTQDGKFKIPTLRNIAVSAPYSHNGSFPTLYDMVSFINNSSGFTPEVTDNLVDGVIVGDIGLTEEQVEALVAFLQTLTDDY
ncbi:c-type cytochrome [Desulfobulbus rhabdoformis]|uniref:cytochrome-c peroxidase n=1 Tax=Desulfobulbus rhabdoformis TaxID=34032 RepID=UPI00196490F4|nr:cytochrome c peroxidase [Desulfobulbus rhabdoformis]MBM9613816.1 c-type cytochrome [Desulfobulbus rhabdoformis]